jgi:hypothetical protein
LNWIYLTERNGNRFFSLGWKIWFVKFFIFIIILSLYWGTLWHLPKCLQNIIVEFTPPSFSFITSPHYSSLEQFQQDSLFHFPTWVHNISTIFTLPYPFLKSVSSFLPVIILYLLGVWEFSVCISELVFDHLVFSKSDCELP